MDRDRTAGIIMDFQNRIVNTAARDPQAVVKNAALVLAGARRAGIPVIHVVHRGGAYKEVSLDTEVHAGVAPAPGDHVIYKTKTSPFSTTGLDVMLREMGRDSLVLMGVSTAGCVLSTIRWAADINYKVAVVSDGCDDPDPEVHRVLTEKIYPRQGPVMTAQEFLQAAGVA
jgi:nicotinamidase-related amidase